ncbi:uncharacterized protein PAC_05638 [Phialocephala subalpina]|uniref:DUF3835 domain-containing protein n=1 Tax=Phialocephala subalpina TaxID=576137 RepID=A0A1L7WSJ9_9HELO|nr:uncharacterized protein PAC_05638 [Phialocephala subalpina]
MAQAVKDSFLDLERHRQLLEENIEKLQKSMRHWQMWEAEYEGLKEEILETEPNQEQLLAIANKYDGELLTKKEIEELLGVPPRPAAQVVNLLDRRIDYVEQNVRTIQKQIETADNKLAAASIISAPEIRNEEGLPMTEIIEELDDEGNIIASRTSTPGDARPQLLEVLKKVGVKDLPADNKLSPSTSKHITSPESNSEPPKDTPKSPKDTSKPRKDAAKSKKKGVAFSEDTKPGPEPQRSHTAKRVEEIMKLAKQSEEKPSEPPIIPKNESPEDAALRREMLQYGMSEVGAVVAELELEEGSDWSDEDYEDGTSETDDEDAFGKSTRKVIDDELRQRMIELEERLGVRAMQNVGKDVPAPEYDIVQEGIGRVTINGQDGTNPKSQPSKDNLTSSIKKNKTQENSATDTSTKKSVSFSEDLDISPAPAPAPVPVPAVPKSGPKRLMAPVSDIVERTTAAEPASAPTLTPKKTSRFKASRLSAGPTGHVLNGPLASSSLSLHPATSSTPKPFSTPIQFSPATDTTHTVPTGPKNAILANKIVERDVALDTNAAPPDEMDPHLLNQEIATEYHKMRNRMIQKQGGFMKEEESEVVPFTEQEGGPKKMSRFKAARLARS